VEPPAGLEPATCWLRIRGRVRPVMVLRFIRRLAKGSAGDLWAKTFWLLIGVWK